MIFEINMFIKIMRNAERRPKKEERRTADRRGQRRYNCESLNANSSKMRMRSNLCATGEAINRIQLKRGGKMREITL